MHTEKWTLIIVKGTYVTLYKNLHVLITFLLANMWTDCNRTLTGDFSVKDAGRIFCSSPKDVT